MILPRSHTWMHLFPPDAGFAGVAADAPGWFREPLEARGEGTRRRALVEWGANVDLPDLVGYDGLVAINRPGLCERRLRRAGFGYVRRFAAVPNLQDARWFIPLDSPAVTSAAFCLYTPFRLSARLKLCAAHAAIRLRAPVWYRDQICIAQRCPPPLERVMQDLFPDQPTRLALSSGAAGPDARRKPAVAVLGLSGEQLAFAKLAGSPVARDLLAHEASVLSALADRSAPAALAPRLLFAGEVESTYTLVQSPIHGRRVGPELTPAHYRFLHVLRGGPQRPAAASGIIATVRRLAWVLPSPRTDLLAVLDEVMSVLSRLNVPTTITHTDFVPWNLRRRPNGDIAAFDWDTAELDGLPVYDEVRHLTFVGFCIRHWAPSHAHEQVRAFAASAPLGLRPPQVQALVQVYLIHAILRFLVQGHAEEHPMVAWHQDLLARLRAAEVRPHAELPRRAGLWSRQALPREEVANG